MTSAHFCSACHHLGVQVYIFNCRSSWSWYMWLLGGTVSLSHSHLYSLFFIRTSNFGAEAENLLIFWRYEPKTLLRLSSVTWYSISINQCGLNQETSSCLSHARAVCFRVPANKMSRQPTVAKFNFTITIEHRGSQRNENKSTK